MSSSADIETRILEMKLDNDEFEKGVRSTIKSLEDLEEKLELKDAGDGFDKVSKAANTVQFSNMERSLDAITDKFSLLGNVGLQALERISNKIVDVGERILKGLTIDPVMDGWSEFEMKTNSIQTIFGGIRNQYENSFAGKSKAFADIGKELDALNEYADQTIYNFAQMTENVGKFTNQNIGLTTATKAIKGIGNWAASVGADSTQMSRAMYNISQALGGGSMKLIDWKSIKYANMATPDVQKMFADIAYAQGGMLGKNGKAYKKGSKQAQQVYASIINDFESSLKSGWLTNEVMMNGLKILSGELKGDELVKLFGDTDEAKKLAQYYEEMGANAMEAATQVKTLSQLIGVLKESLGSGWATSFEKLFGGFQTQVEFFTKIANLIGARIDKDADSRNSWIDTFTKNNHGTDLLLNTILKIIDLFTELWGLAQEVTDALIEPFNGLFQFTTDIASLELFGGYSTNLNDTGLTAQRVAGIFGDLYHILSLIGEWFHGDRTLDDGTFQKATPAYENAKKIFAGLGSVVMIALNALESFGRFVLYLSEAFEPLASSILNLFGNVGGILYSIYQNIAGQHMFDDFFRNLLIVVSPVVDAIIEFLSLIVDVVASLFDLGNTIDETGAMAENNKLGPFIKLLSDVFKVLPLLLAPVTGFLTNIVKSMSGFVGGVVKGFPAIKKHVKKEGVTPFQDLKDIVQEFIAEGFGEEAAKTITDWYNNNVKGTLKSLVEWFGTSYDSITTFFSELPGKVTKLVERVKAAFNAFSNYNYNDSLTPFENFKERMKQTILALFGEETGNNIINQYKKHVAPRIKEVADMVEGAFSEVKRILDGILKVFQGDYSNMENPFDVLQAIASNFLEGYDKDVDKDTFDKDKINVANFFESLEKAYDEEIKPIVDKVLGWVTKELPSALESIDRFLFGYEARDNTNANEVFHVPGLFENILSWIKGEGKEKLTEILEFVGDIWTSIYRALFGYDKPMAGNPEKRAKRLAGENTVHVNGIFETVIAAIKEVYTKVSEWIHGEGSEIWNSVVDFFFGEVDVSTNKRSGGAIQAILDWYNEHSAEIEEVINVKIPEIFRSIKTTLFGGDQAVKVGENEDGPVYQIQHVDSIFKPVLDWVNGDGKKALDEIVEFFETSWESINHVLFGYEDAIDPEGTATEHIPGLFENLKEWTEGKGTEIWTEITDFLLGKKVVDSKTGDVSREGGAWQAIETFLDPIADWISQKGEIVYSYLTEHNFEEMWADLDAFLFGAKDLQDPTGQKRIDGGVLTPILDILQPIAEFFGSIGNSLITKIQGIDFGEVWQKIYEFFNGKDIQVLTRDNTISNETFFETKHIDGLFERIASFFDRIIAFFESDTWKGIKDAISSFWNEYIKPIMDFFGSLGGEFFKSIGEWNLDKGFFENIGVILSSMSDKASTEFPKLLEKFGIKFEGIPELFNTFLGGLFPSNVPGVDEATKGNEDTVSSIEQKLTETSENNKTLLEQLGDIITGIFVSTASAEDAETDKITGSAENAEGSSKKNTTIVEDVINSISGGANKLFSGAGEAIGGFLGGITNNAGPLLTVLGVAGTVGSISKITTSIYGTENKGTIDKIADLLDALSGFIEKIVWLVGLTALSDLADQCMDTDFDPLKHALDAILDFITRIVLLMGGGSLVMALVDAGIQLGGDWGEDKLNTTMSADFTTMSENMEGIGTGINYLMSAVSLMLDNVWKILGTEAVLELLLGKGEDSESKLPRLKEGIGLVTDCLTSLLGGITWKSLFPVSLMNLFTGAGEGLLGGYVFKKFGLRTRSDGVAASIAAMGSLIQSVFEGVSNILNAITLMSLLTNPDDVREKISLVKDLMGVLPDIFNAIGEAVKKFAAYKFANAINGLDFTNKTTGVAISTGGTEYLGSKAKFVSKIPAFVEIALIVIAFADLIAIVIERNIQRTAPILYVAATLISNAINAFKEIDFGAQNNASASIETAKKMLKELGTWKKGIGSDPMGNSILFRDAMSNVALGFKTITKSMNGYDPKSTALIDALGQMNDAWNYFSTANEGKGFDVADFQAKLSVLQYAGLNISSVSESFRGVTDEDVGHVSTVVSFMRNVAEVAEVVSTIYGLGSLGTQMNFGYDAGLGSMMSFLKELSYVGTVSKDEAGNIDGIEELDPEKIRGVFITMIEALPDPAENKELFDKLHSFIDAGGGNLGLFVNGFTGLNRALERYREIMYQIGTDDFVQQANALTQIDQLGQSMTTDYKFLNNGSVGNMNTRLGTFANDLSMLADNLLKIGQNAKEVNKDGDVLGDVADFLHRINNLGAIYEIFDADDGQWHATNEFGNHLNTFVSDFNSLESAFGSFCQHLVKTDDYDFDSGVLDTAATFFERIAGVWNALGPAEGKPVVESMLTDAYDQFIAQTDRLTRLGTALPVLGDGLKDFYAGVKEIPFEDDLAKTRLLEGIGVASEIVKQVYTPLQSTSFDSYRASYLGKDLFSADPNNPGLFNVFGPIFTAAKDFDTTGMANAKTAIDSIVNIIGPAKSLLQETLTGSSYRLMDLANDLYNDEGTGLFNVMTKAFSVDSNMSTMPVSEIQAYASAFSDLSNAMTMNGQAGMLAQAVDDALNALKDKEIEVRVTPVWNLPDNMPNGPIAPSWGFRPNITNDYSASTIQNIQFPAVQAVSLAPEDLSAITRSASDAGILVADSVNDMNSTIGSLQVKLDTGVLVGYLAPAVNKFLGRNYQNPRVIIVRNTGSDDNG